MRKLQQKLAWDLLLTPASTPKKWGYYLYAHHEKVEPVVAAYVKAACDIFNDILHDPSLEQIRATWLASWPPGVGRPGDETTIQIEHYERYPTY